MRRISVLTVRRFATAPLWTPEKLRYLLLFFFFFLFLRKSNSTCSCSFRRNMAVIAHVGKCVLEGSGACMHTDLFMNRSRQNHAG
jgi:hypothetical protein